MASITEKILGNKVDRLGNASKDAIDIFTKTVVTLQGLNAEADEQAAEKQKELEKIQEDLKSLATMKAKHEKVINKINKIFEE